MPETTTHPLLAPPSPLLQRLPRGARTAAAGCVAAAVAVLLYAALGSGPLPGGNTDSQGPFLAVLALLAAAPLTWAPRWPAIVLVFLLAEAAAASGLGIRAEQIWPLYPATTLLVAVIAAARTARTGCVAALATLAVQETVLQLDLFRDGGAPRVFAAGFIGLTACLALLVLLAWSAGAYVRQRRAYGEALRAHAAAQAVTAERLRIARELHDMVAHSIGVVAIQAGAAQRVLDSEPERVREALTAIETTGRDTLRGLRSMLDLLRRTDAQTSPGAEAAPLAGLADLDRLVAATAHAGVRVEVHHRGAPRALPEAVDRSAFRVVQESVTNVVRHAGARHCRVTLAWRQRELSVEIVDDGSADGDDAAGAAHAAGAGYGIQGMRERVALLEGTFAAGPRAGGGFRAAAVFPLPLHPPDPMVSPASTTPTDATAPIDPPVRPDRTVLPRPGEAAS
ncbi:histidine kinase [Streptomyces sp. NBC_01565]|uniref:sensor histidine kinase n=1 Tax=Streptomyces sp. NBC_01565 TaxID=2975881 RepID=UPI00224E4E00|nr:histidine kinase [Streptomyces sp. NBC_01565]MCX4546463.1 histidine kinase [Streptomyces sp. NBC_01565]